MRNRSWAANNIVANGSLAYGSLLRPCGGSQGADASQLDGSEKAACNPSEHPWRTSSAPWRSNQERAWGAHRVKWVKRARVVANQPSLWSAARNYCRGAAKAAGAAGDCGAGILSSPGDLSTQSRR